MKVYVLIIRRKLNSFTICSNTKVANIACTLTSQIKQSFEINITGDFNELQRL